ATHGCTCLLVRDIDCDLEVHQMPLPWSKVPLESKLRLRRSFSNLTASPPPPPPPPVD
ncbi:unnamed protein product, partial [Musa textilis]